jgi:hypothetical protein
MPTKRFLRGARHRRQAVIKHSLPVMVDQPRNCGTAQQAIIALLVTALHSEGADQINYDHVRLPVPKSPVPLTYRKHRYDIAIGTPERVILIDVLSVDARYWQREQVTEHGETESETTQRLTEPPSRA